MQVGKTRLISSTQMTSRGSSEVIDQGDNTQRGYFSFLPLHSQFIKSLDCKFFVCFILTSDNAVPVNSAYSLFLE